LCPKSISQLIFREGDTNSVLVGVCGRRVTAVVVLDAAPVEVVDSPDLGTEVDVELDV